MATITSGGCAAVCKPSLGRVARYGVQEDQAASEPAGCIPDVQVASEVPGGAVTHVPT